MDLTREQWPSGWIPSESKHGDPNALLRMDNLHADESGALTLVRGEQKVNSAGTFSDFIERIYSKVINGSKYRYVSTGFNSTQIYRSKNGTFSDKVLMVGADGANREAAFGSALGNVIAISGRSARKDDGTDIQVLGIIPGGKPIVETESPSALSFGPIGVWSVDPGTIADNFGDSINVEFSDLPQLQTAATLLIGNYNTYQLPSGFSNKPDLDIISFGIAGVPLFIISSVTIEASLSDPFGDYTDYYTYTFVNDVNSQDYSAFQNEASTVLSTKRGNFSRVGLDSTKNWTNVVAFRIILNFNSFTSGIIIGGPKIYGGPRGYLFGQYEYATQCIYDNGIYLAKSALSPASDPVNILNGFGIINNSAQLNVFTVSNDNKYNQIWLYRRSVGVTSILTIENGRAVNVDVTPKLDKWYRVAVCYLTNGLASFPIEDTTSDDDALLLDINPNENLARISDLTEPIIGMEGIYYERMLYLSPSNLYLSDRLNPDAIDLRYTIKPSGDPTEQNLWVKKVTNGVILIGTTKDIYVVRGTLDDLPDGTIDAQVDNIGESHPPISVDVCSDNGTLFYRANDGWRATSGSNSINISVQLRYLYENHTQYGFTPFATYPANTARYPCTVGRNKLFVSEPKQDGTRWCLVFDLQRKIWRAQYTNPASFFTEEDGTVLAGYGLDDGDYYLRTFDDAGTGEANLVDGVSGQNIYFQTVFDDNQQPRNRKDVFTLKVQFESGGEQIDILMAKDDSDTYVLLGRVSASTPTEKFFEIADTVGLGFRYSILIKNSFDSSLKVFKLFKYTIEYQPRPEQINYIRLLPTNLGTSSRKRFINYPVVIDTLGNIVKFTPLVDNVAFGNSSNITTLTKLTNIHYFRSECIGIDIGAILYTEDGSPFEFYEALTNEILSEKLPVAAEYLVIPGNNYGNPNRKRHSSYKFVINTRGGDVRFTPIIDGVLYSPQTFNTTVKTTVEYFFSSDTSGIDIGGILETLASTPFEFYGEIIPQQVEVFPPRLKEFRIPESNLGVAAVKRIRTLPMQINTNGHDVTFTPIVDGVSLTPTTLNSATRKTVYHYFDTDVFGTDFSGELIGTNAFEFYGLQQPEEVEVLPVPKKYDQIGPLRFDKYAKLYTIRFRLISFDTSIPVSIYLEDTIDFQAGTTPDYSTTLVTKPNTDNVYELDLPKNVGGSTIRIVLGGHTSTPFHRLGCSIKLAVSGMDTSNRWVHV